LHHGFTIEENTHDCVDFEIRIEREEGAKIDWGNKVVKDIIAKSGMRGGKALINPCLKYPIPEAVWLFLSLKMNTYVDLDRKKWSGQKLLGKSTPAAAAYLLDLIDARIVQYDNHLYLRSVDHPPSLALLTGERALLDDVRKKLVNDTHDSGEMK
jgi:hypothetical protein